MGAVAVSVGKGAKVGTSVSVGRGMAVSVGKGGSVGDAVAVGVDGIFVGDAANVGVACFVAAACVVAVSCGGTNCVGSAPSVLVGCSTTALVLVGREFVISVTVSGRIHSATNPHT